MEVYIKVLKKIVLWSTVEKTALADAEVEYLDHTSNTIYVAFDVKKTDKDFRKTHIIIWTTTPGLYHK